MYSHDVRSYKSQGPQNTGPGQVHDETLVGSPWRWSPIGRMILGISKTERVILSISKTEKMILCISKTERETLETAKLRCEIFFFYYTFIKYLSTLLCHIFQNSRTQTQTSANPRYFVFFFWGRWYNAFRPAVIHLSCMPVCRPCHT